MMSMKRIKAIWPFLMVMFLSIVVVSCDKDDIDEFTASVVDNPWETDKGEIIEFYRSFNGVIYANAEDYGRKTIDKSFIWTETEGKLTIAIDGFRNDNGDMEHISGEDLILKTYHIESSTDKKIVLTDGSERITLNAYKKR